MKTKYYIYKIVALSIIALTFYDCSILFSEKERQEWEEFRKEVRDATGFDYNFNYIFPKQTVGVSAGVGWENEFEQTNFCIGADYNFRLTNDIEKNSAWYVRGSAHYTTSSFDDFSSNHFNLGVKPHIQIPITPHKEGQLTLGANLNYLFGSEDFGSSTDDFSGIQAGIFAGINIRASESLSWGVEFPVLQHLNLTYEPEGGGPDVDVSDTSLAINKYNPVMVYARFSLGGNNRSQ